MVSLVALCDGSRTATSNTSVVISCINSPRVCRAASHVGSQEAQNANSAEYVAPPSDRTPYQSCESNGTTKWRPAMSYTDHTTERRPWPSTTTSSVNAFPAAFTTPT